MENLCVPQNIIAGMVIFTDRKIDTLDTDEVKPIIELPLLLGNLAGFNFSPEQAAEIKGNTALARYRRGIESSVSISPTHSLDLAVEIGKPFSTKGDKQFTFTARHRISANGDVETSREYNAVFVIDGFGIRRSQLYISEMEFDSKRQKLISDKLLCIRPDNVIERVMGIANGKELLGKRISTQRLITFVVKQ